MSSACGREEARDLGSVRRFYQLQAEPVAFLIEPIRIAGQFNALAAQFWLFFLSPLSPPSIARQPPALAAALCVQHLLQQHKKFLFLEGKKKKKAI